MKKFLLFASTIVFAVVFQTALSIFISHCLNNPMGVAIWIGSLIGMVLLTIYVFIEVL